MPISSASPSIQTKEVRSERTWSRSWSYSCLHWSLYCLSVVAGWPLAGFGAVFFLFATHLVNSGASGTEAPGWPLDLEATLIQCSKSSFSIGSPSTEATALPGTPPQPTATAASGGEGAQRQEESSNLDHEKALGRGDGNTVSAARCAQRLGHGALLG